MAYLGPSSAPSMELVPDRNSFPIGTRSRSELVPDWNSFPIGTRSRLELVLGALLRRHRLPRYRHRLSRAMGKRPSGLGRFPGFPARAFARVESRAARLTVLPVYGPIRYRSYWYWSVYSTQCGSALVLWFGRTDPSSGCSATVALEHRRPVGEHRIGSRRGPSHG